MAGRRCEVTDVREVLRRLRLGEPARRIARELGLSRNTVAGYHRWARQHGLLTGELPDAAALATLLHPPERAQPPPEQSGVAPFRDQVVAWRQQKRLRCQLRQLKPYGQQPTVTCYAWPGPPGWMLNDITAIRSFCFTIPEFYANQQMILEGKLNAKTLATHSFPLDEVRRAYDQFAVGDTLKVMVKP